MKASADKFNDLFNSLPNTDVILNLSYAIDKTATEIKHSHILNFLNYVVVAVCLAVVVSIGYQTYVARADINAIHNSVENIRKGIYNSKGWSVLEGAQNNEWTFSQEHPDSYQHWLESVQKK